MTKEMKERFNETRNKYINKVYWELKLMKRWEGHPKEWNRANNERGIYLEMIRDLENILDLPSDMRFDYCKARKECGYSNY